MIMQELVKNISTHYLKIVTTLALALISWNFKISLETSEAVKLNSQRMDFQSEDIEGLEKKIEGIESNRFTEDQAKLLIYRIHKIEEKIGI